MKNEGEKRDILKNLRQSLERTAKTVADGAVDVGGKVAETATSAGKQASDFIVNTAEAAREQISNFDALDLVDNAKNTIAEKANEKEAREFAHNSRLDIALAEAKGSPCAVLLDELGESPLPVTLGNADKVKAAFPIPREQTILWASAEFDLRPSGVALTDEGIFIKSDAKAFALPGSEDETRSTLTYIRWAYFEPSWLGEPNESNPLLAVDRSCSLAFVEACRTIGVSQAKLTEFDSFDDSDLEHSSRNHDASIVAGANALSAETAVFAEQRATPAGHGEMAEEAITMLDKLHGSEARVCGRDNAKNGADRWVDGISIQTKYYKSARGSLEACFDPASGQYRYYDGKGTPMQLEVPKDQYDNVVRGFEKKIKQGKVPGVKDPKMAKEIVRKGRLTYEQAVNLTKPGTIESLAYDAATGAVQCSFAFGISFLASAFNAYRRTGNVDESIQAGFASGLQVFGTSFAQHMVISQLSRTGLANTLMKPSQIVVEKLGYKASATIVNGLRALSGKPAISGIAASKQLAKMMRSNAVTSAITFAVFSVPETYKLASGKASGAQYAKNLSSIAGSVLGGAGGAIAAGAAASKIGAAVGTTITPGIGTAIGIVGGMVGGAAGSFAVNTVGNVLYEGDAAAFTRFFNALVSCMSIEYMLADNEIDELVATLNEVDSKEFKTLLEQTMVAENQEDTVQAFLTPVFESIVATRASFAPPSDEEIEQSVVAYLEKLEEDEDEV